MSDANVQRLPAEQLFQKELDALMEQETGAVPQGWRMSPKSVLTYICGGRCGNMDISAKYIGDRRLVEIAIATLVSNSRFRSIASRSSGTSSRPLALAIMRIRLRLAPTLRTS